MQVLLLLKKCKINNALYNEVGQINLKKLFFFLREQSLFMHSTNLKERFLFQRQVAKIAKSNY